MDMIDGAAWVWWNLAPGATGSDVLRGLTSALPVGPGGDDETCLGSDLTDTVILDRANPAPGDAYWYVVRGVNACGHGPYGSEGHGGVPAGPRISATCP